MAKKVILKDDNVEIMPITRGELILDSSGQLAFHSSQFLATQSLPGLMSGEDKTKLDSLEKVTVEDKKVEQVNTTTNSSYRILFSNSADDTTKTEGARKSAKLLFNPSTGALTATALIGKLNWSNLNNVPENFTPAQHIHNTSEITALTSYSKASSASDLVTTDTLNAALGKLEYKADTAYDWIISVTTADTDKYINKWQEILDFLNAIDNTEGADITDEFVTRKTGQTITGEKIFSGTSSELLTIDRNSESPALVRFAKNGTVLGYIGIDNTKKPVVSIDGTVHYVLHSGNSHITNGVITINNQTITPITSHQSLANYVTLNGKQDITGEKTFKATVKAYDINPVTNNTYSLGTSSLAWKNVYATNGNFSSTVNASGFVKKDSSDDYILLGGGGHKSISSFQTTYDGRYVLKAGDTMTGPLTISTSNWGNLLVLNRVNNGENWGPSIIFKFDGTHNGALTMLSNLLYIGDNGGVRYKAWHEGNDGSGSGLDADLLDGKHLSSFITYELATGYVGASFNSEDLSKKAASTYIEYWDSTGGWFNSRWGLVLAISGFHRVGSSDSYVLLGGGGHKLESSLSVNYATSASSATYAGKLSIHDIRDATRNPNYFDAQRMTAWFNNTGTPDGNWYSGIHMKGWTNGYTSWELCSYSSTGTANDYNLYFRSGNNTTWGSWKTIITSGNIGSQSVNYATSAGNADTVDSCHKDDFLRRTATLGSINKFVLEDIPKGVTQVGSIGWTDYQNHPHAGGLWMTLRGTSSLRTALILFPSYSMSSPPILYSSIDGGAWQGGYQLAYTSQIPTTMAWGNITGKPSTFTPSTHYHNYFPENTAVYFRDPNNASWRGGMYWGSAGNEALCFVAVNANTSFRFFTGSDLANWTSSTWQGTPSFEVNKNGAYAPHFYESSDIKLKTNVENISTTDNIPQLKKFNWKSDGSIGYGLIAQELEAMGYSELVEESGDHKTVNYSAALSLIVGKLQVKIKELEKEIEILKNKN